MKLQAGKPVIGKDLIGREKEADLIKELLLQGQSVVLIAPRRFGKTSLALEVLSRLKKEGHFTAYLDLFAIPDIRHLSEQITTKVLSNKKLDKLFRDLRKNLGQLVKNIEFKQIVEEFEFVLKYTSPETDDWDLLSESIDFIESFASKYKHEIFCGLDEFGDISKLDGERIVKLFRSKIQLQQNSAYLFSGSSESMMESLFLRKNAPFYRLARVIELDYINRYDFAAYIERTLKKSKIPYREGNVDEILDFTGGHPYYTQLILQQVYIKHSLSPSSFRFRMPAILDELLILERNYLEKLWEDVSKRKEHRMVVMKVAEGKGAIYSQLDYRSINVARTLKALKGSGMILKSDSGKHHLSDPLFSYWIKKKVLKL